MPIRLKLILLSILLVLLPMAVLAGVALRVFSRSGADAVAETRSALHAQSEAQLTAAVRAESGAVLALAEQGSSHARLLAKSSMVVDHLTLLDGTNQTWNDLALREPQRVVEGILNLCAIHAGALPGLVRSNARVVESLVAGHGPVALGDPQVVWESVHPLTKAKESVPLPTLRLGDAAITQVRLAKEPAVVIDEAVAQVGGVVAVCQRVNPAGDMLVVSTSINRFGSRRAIGLLMPARNESKDDPLIAEVLAGRPAYGRTLLVNSWCSVAYAPIRDASGTVVGMLISGQREHDNRALAQAITAAKVGQEGETFVADGEGRVLIHAEAGRIGGMIAAPPHPKGLAAALTLRGQPGVRYLELEPTAERRRRFALCGWFAEWDWLVCSTGYCDDLTRSGAAKVLDLLKASFANLHQIGLAPGGSVSLYRRIALLDRTGSELVVVAGGQPATAGASRREVAWFKAAAQAAPGSVALSPVGPGADGGEVLRMVAPVQTAGGFAGAVVIELDWRLVESAFASHLYGASGTPFILGQDGGLLTRPRRRLPDEELAALQQAIGGAPPARAGSSRFSFAGVDSFAAFAPLALGDATYRMVVSAPVSEFAEAAERIERGSRTTMRTLTWMMLGLVGVLGALGVAAGLLVSRTVTRPLHDLLHRLAEIADGDGDLTLEVPERGRCEMALLARTFNRFREKLRVSVRGIAGQTARLAEMSGQLAEVSRAVAASSELTTREAAAVDAASEEVHANLRALAHGMQEMSQSVQEVARSCAAAAATATTAAGGADAGGVRARQLDASSRQIAELVRVIEVIAHKTGSLALNATIEAARAGAAGRGFAVVAGEVKAMSISTAESTRSISGTVAAIQGEISAVVASFQGIVATIKEIESAQSGIAGSAEEQAATTRGLSANIAQAVEASGGIAARMAEVVKAARAADALVERTEGLVGALAGTAAELKREVGRFRY